MANSDWSPAILDVLLVKKIHENYPETPGV